MERERLERQQQNEEDESKRRRNKQEDTNDDEPPQQGHINLFPEAREAEIRLAHGGSSSSSNGGGDAEKQKSGILPLPLGGNESTNRKLGNVPFYMQTQSSSRQEDDKYVNSSHLGIRRNRMGVTTSSDEITNSIMRDQFASREEYRKQKNDPMSRFSVDSSDAAAGNIYANRESSSRAEHYAFQNHVEATSSGGVNNSPHHEHGQSQSRKRKEHNKSGEDDCSKDSFSSSSSSLSSNSSVSRDRRRRNKSRRKHDSKQSKRSKHRHRSDYSPLHSKKKRHKDKKSKRKHHSNSKEPDDGDRRRKRHNNPSLLPYSASNMDLMECKMSDDQQLLDDMRRRRHDREAREMERQRQLMR